MGKIIRQRLSEYDKEWIMDNAKNCTISQIAKQLKKNTELIRIHCKNKNIQYIKIRKSKENTTYKHKNENYFNIYENKSWIL